MPTPKVAVIVGSLRRDSLNRKMAHALGRIAAPRLDFDDVPIDLPLYDQDLDSSPPQPWTAFRDRVRPADAVLFVTPEYNRSMPGAIKNAIDVGSRPYGHSVWKGKPAAVVSVSPGTYGGFGANHHLRQCLVFLDMPVLAQPEMYIAGAGNLFDEKGEVTAERTRALMATFVDAFATWVTRFAAK